MKSILTLIIGLCLFQLTWAQEQRVGLGFYGDFDLQQTSSVGSFGIQGKYDLSNHQSVQAQVYGRSNYVAVGADYLVSLFNKTKSNFNIFGGAGVSQDYVSYALDNDVSSVKVRDQFFKGNLQTALSYYFKPVQLSVYSGYKWNYNFSSESTNSNHIILGIRYHLW